MKTLIQGGADPATLKDYDGRTALHLAAAEGRLPVTRFLLRYHDIDVNQVRNEKVEDLEIRYFLYLPFYTFRGISGVILLSMKPFVIVVVTSLTHFTHTTQPLTLKQPQKRFRDFLFLLFLSLNSFYFSRLCTPVPPMTQRLCVGLQERK